MKQLKEIRELGGSLKRKEKIHPFGLIDGLFTPKHEQVKAEKSFKGMLKNLDDGIAERERMLVDIQQKNKVRNSVSLMTRD